MRYRALQIATVTLGIATIAIQIWCWFADKPLWPTIVLQVAIIALVLANGTKQQPEDTPVQRPGRSI